MFTCILYVTQKDAQLYLPWSIHEEHQRTPLSRHHSQPVFQHLAHMLQIYMCSKTCCVQTLSSNSTNASWLRHFTFCTLLRLKFIPSRTVHKDCVRCIHSHSNFNGSTKGYQDQGFHDNELRNECLFFWVHGGMNQSAGQTNRMSWEAVFGQFVCSTLRFISPRTQKKDIHSLYLQCFQQRPFLNFIQENS